MPSWSNIIEEYPEHGEQATLILMYLSLGRDYPYYIGKTLLESGILSKVESLKTLIDKDIEKVRQNKIAAMMKKMAKDSLLISEADKSSDRQKNFYRINPELLFSNDKRSEFQIEPPDINLMSIIKDFLITIRSNDKKPYLEDWGTNIKVFDYCTFLLFLLKESRRINNTVMFNHLKENLTLLLQDGIDQRCTQCKLDVTLNERGEERENQHQD